MLHDYFAGSEHPNLGIAVGVTAGLAGSIFAIFTDSGAISSALSIIVAIGGALYAIGQLWTSYDIKRESARIKKRLLEIQGEEDERRIRSGLARIRDDGSVSDTKHGRNLDGDGRIVDDSVAHPPDTPGG